MPSPPQGLKLGPPGPVRTRRYKAAMACTTCRRRKLKCDGVRPACSRCSKDAGRRGPCTYILTSEMESNGGGGGGEHGSETNPQRGTRSPAAMAPAHLPTPSTSAHEAGEVAETYHDSNAGPFVSKVAAAIDARLGISSKEQMHIPMLDAPLFGTINPLQSYDWGRGRSSNIQSGNGSTSEAFHVLPPRRHADVLLSLYWDYCEALEPCLDQRRFSRAYEAIYAGGESDYDERVFHSTLNVVFALASQLQESIPAAERDRASAAFFLRAWSLLRPEAAVWEAGSLELVQCLLLMSRYLQCAGNTKLMWMVEGSAVRVAVALGLHHFDRPSPDGEEGARLRREVWTGIAYMEKNMSWILGRPLTVNLLPSSSRPAAPSHDEGATAFISDKILELEEFHSQLLLFQSLSNTGFADYLPQSTTTTKPDIHTAQRFDERLMKLSASFESYQGSVEDGAFRRAIIFRLRVPHTRLLIFRPMFTRFCLSQTQASSQASPLNMTDRSLEDRIYQDCATICLESSQKIIELVSADQRANGGAGILPWWYRAFWLCIASQHVVAAMLRPDVFGAVAPAAWATALAAYQAEEHLGPALERLSTTWGVIGQKVADLHNQQGEDQMVPVEAASDPNFQNVFQYLGLGAGVDGMLGLGLGLENESWFEGVENFHWNF